MDIFKNIWFQQKSTANFSSASMEKSQNQAFGGLACSKTVRLKMKQEGVTTEVFIVSDNILIFVFPAGAKTWDVSLSLPPHRLVENATDPRRPAPREKIVGTTLPASGQAGRSRDGPGTARSRDGASAGLSSEFRWRPPG